MRGLTGLIYGLVLTVALGHWGNFGDFTDWRFYALVFAAWISIGAHIEHEQADAA